MLTLITGLPGSGKTLNLLKMIDSDPLYKNRPIFYFNIKELKLENWLEIDEQQALEWYDLPDNSVVVMDECQRLFRPKKFGDAVPRAVEEFETHRHRGFDIFIITQHPKLIDTNVRRLCGQHINFERGYGFRRVRKLVWQKCMPDPDDYHARQEAEKSYIRLDKKYFDVYKSTEVDTHKPKIPKKLVIVVLVTLIPVTGAILLYNKFTSPAQNIGVSQHQLEDESGFLNHDSQSKGQPITRDEYIAQFKPRIFGLPHTAPFYDSVTEPKTFPKPNCVLQVNTGRCSCYSQQATRMRVDTATCNRIVEYGWFDYTKEDSKPDKQNKRQKEHQGHVVQPAIETYVYDLNGNPHPADAF